MKAFITGATGFIGGNLAKTLLEKGDEVVCLVRPGSNISRLQQWGAHLVQGDLLNLEKCTDQILGCDIIFHVAGVTKATNAQDYYRGNVQATENLLQILQLPQAKKQKLIYISSQAAAGPSLSPDFTEGDIPVLPISEYGKSKHGAEEAIVKGKSDGNFTILRPSIVFGPQDHEMLPLFRAARVGIIPHPGFDDFPVNFIYITDLIEAILLVADHPAAAGKTYFVHDGQPSSWKTMNNLIKKEVNNRAIILPIARSVLQLVCHFSELAAKMQGKARYMNLDKWLEIKQPGWLCSCDKIQKELGFTSRWTLEDAVSETASWYRKNRLL